MISFKCTICGAGCKDEQGVETHMLFTHGSFMSPCGTGLAEKELMIHDKLRKRWKEAKHRRNEYRSYILRVWKEHVFRNEVGYKWEIHEGYLAQILRSEWIPRWKHKEKHLGDNTEYRRFVSMLNEYVRRCRVYNQVVEEAVSVGCLLE